MSREKDGYVEIKIPSPDDKPINKMEAIEVELEDETDDPVDQEPLEAKEKPTHQRSKNVDFAEDDKPRVSRAQKRIKQLHGRTVELELEVEKERQEKLELQRQLNKGAKQTSETIKEKLEGQISLMNKQLIEAMKNGEAEATVALQNDIMDAKRELGGVSERLANYKEVEEPKQQPRQQRNDVPEKALEWIDQYPQFKKDELFHVASLTINNQLINEGFDPESEDFYEELNERLAPRFPEVFGVSKKKVVSSKKDSVEYTQDDYNDASDEGDDGEFSEVQDEKDEPQSKPLSKRVTEQTVSSPSRTSPTIAKKVRKPNSVTLSPADIAQADRWGLSLEQMARRIKHSENSKSGDGYVPIFIGKN